MEYRSFTKSDLELLRFYIRSGASKEAIFHHIQHLTDEIYEALTLEKLDSLLLNSSETSIFVPYKRKIYNDTRKRRKNL